MRQETRKRTFWQLVDLISDIFYSWRFTFEEILDQSSRMDGLISIDQKLDRSCLSSGDLLYMFIAYPHKPK